ncbi:MAG: carboxylating nicotinate-nucleotide diphosphorylase [Acidobacteria bacterium]|nr:carboxylating nicotinate-nucleotide diphosphorylase [Acidobacteriota bacterium]
MSFDIGHPEVVTAVERALAEDIGTGDITTLSTVPEDRMARGVMRAREELVVAGVELLPLIYRMRGALNRLELKRVSGEVARDGETVAEVEGPARLLLETERTALNFVQRLSGVATMARRYADAVRHTRTRILDTRKTTPGLRRLEKAAAAAGGIVNHRAGLWDAILIKNNHIAAAGGVTAALRAAAQAGVPVEIEVRTRAELDEALAAGAENLLLDNLTPAEAREWVSYIGGRAVTELSGGISLETVGAYAEAGADFISVGAITHSAPAVDLHFRLELLS